MNKKTDYVIDSKSSDEQQQFKLYCVVKTEEMKEWQKCKNIYTYLLFKEFNP